MITIHQLLQTGKARLKEAGIESYALDTELLLMHALKGKSREWLLMHREEKVENETQEIFFALIEQRLNYKPVSQLLGKKGFWKDDFIVTSDVLTPRPETELVIEAAHTCFPDKDQPLHMLDLGTGSGCLLLSLLQEFPNAHGVGIDKSSAALAIAKKNALGITSGPRAIFKEGDWEKGLQKQFDIVVSNPPYIPSSKIPGLMPEVAHWEPTIALDGGNDGLACYRQIAIGINDILIPGGYLIMECGEGQANAIISIFTGQQDVKNIMEHSITLLDLAGIERCLIFRNKR